MDCAEVMVVLQQFLDGELDDARGDGLAAHLDACRRCGLEAETYQQIKISLGERREPLSDDAIERLRTFAAGLHKR